MKKILFSIMILLSTNATADNVYVKYKGLVDVDNGHFSHLSLKHSSFINNIYYDDDNSYLLVQLNSTFYHYCSIPNNTVSNWVESPSLGRFYNANVKGNFDCRKNPQPTY